MKIFVSVVLTTLVLGINADVGGYNYAGQQHLMQILSNSLQQHQQQQPQQQILNNAPLAPPSQSQLPLPPPPPAPSQLPPISLPPPQPTPQQPQYQIMLPINQPSIHYLPAPALQFQRYQPTLLPQPNIVTTLPMPIGFPGLGPVPRPVSRRLRPRARVAKKPIITKNFFIHSAPEETEDDIQEELAQLAQQPRKHYNVLFVKTPAQTSRTAALNLAKSLKEEKTVVYVLSKKTSAADLQDAIADAPQNINKPEVFFIKYRTPEEAANAQRQIQTQYDSLGGSSTITDEGVAPITSVVGSLDAPEEEEPEEEQSQQTQQQAQVQAQQQQQQLPEPGAPQQQFSEQLSGSINNNNAGNQYLPPPNQF